MSISNPCEEIKRKREDLGITVKEFSDALGLGRSGEKMVRAWEAGDSVPSDKLYQKILSFANERPYIETVENGKFRFIDLFAGPMSRFRSN